MSLILDALKKIEQERARRQVRSPELGPELVKDRTRPSRTSWRLIILITVIVITTASLTALTIKLSSKPQPQPLSREVSAQKAEPQITPAPKDTVPVASAPSPVSVLRPVVSPHASPPKITPPLPPPPQADLAEGTSAPELTVSGIAWQDDRSDRRAVVNGVLVSEGSIIAGARIREILPDKVRFTIGSRIVEITNSSPLH